ncbi:hypothetical protein [Sneathia sanguinegens]|uniref:hypothetical protein n=1 Tax=Sneathia sanguinegens TaxID=40543 RepID=UPI00288C1438|nr:hypothetical protein [Sneathia sanguinegens]
MENPLNFKTYDEFVKDKKNEILDLIDYDEKLEIYIKYCKTKDNCYLPSHNNTEEPIKLVFEGNLNDLAKNMPHNTYSAIKTLDDKFTDNELIDFITENKNIDFEDLYIEYIDNTLKEAKKSMSKDEFSEALKEYTSEEMIKKYPDVYDTINYSYSDFILDEKDIQKSKEIDDDLER